MRYHQLTNKNRDDPFKDVAPDKADATDKIKEPENTD